MSETLGKPDCKKCHGTGYVQSEMRHPDGHGPHAWAALCECVDMSTSSGTRRTHGEKRFFKAKVKGAVLFPAYGETADALANHADFIECQPNGDPLTAAPSVPIGEVFASMQTTFPHPLTAAPIAAGDSLVNKADSRNATASAGDQQGGPCDGTLKPSPESSVASAPADVSSEFKSLTGHQAEHRADGAGAATKFRLPDATDQKVIDSFGYAMANVKVPQQPDQQLSEAVRNFDREDWKEMRQIISDQSAAITALQARVLELEQIIQFSSAANCGRDTD